GEPEDPEEQHEEHADPGELTVAPEGSRHTDGRQGADEDPHDEQQQSDRDVADDAQHAPPAFAAHPVGDVPVRCRGVPCLHTFTVAGGADAEVSRSVTSGCRNPADRLILSIRSVDAAPTSSDGRLWCRGDTVAPTHVAL